MFTDVETATAVRELYDSYESWRDAAEAIALPHKYMTLHDLASGKQASVENINIVRAAMKKNGWPELDPLPVPVEVIVPDGYEVKVVKKRKPRPKRVTKPRSRLSVEPELAAWLKKQKITINELIRDAMADYM